MLREKKNDCQKKEIYGEIRYILDLNNEDIEKNFINPTQNGKKEWLKKNRGSNDKIEDFYKNCDYYIYELLKENNYYGARCNLFPKIKSNILPTDKILDFGCGVGNLSLYLYKNNFKQIYLADLDTQTFEFCRKRFDIRNYDYKYFKLQIDEMPKNFFEKIICLDVIEHLNEPEKVLSDFFLFLKNKGKLILQICFKNSEDLPMHLNKIKKDKYKKIMLNIGFKLESEEKLIDSEESLVIWSK
ncbi:class I SAM-dependent methyltransferase [Candidatus Dependentiae bacterium]|nr:class I SAM-dependent methyltransferase [Candidatus Dependentiae bacterium]